MSKLQTVTTRMEALLQMALSFIALLKEMASGQPEPSVTNQESARLRTACETALGEDSPALRPDASFDMIAKEVREALGRERGHLLVVGHALTAEEKRLSELADEAEQLAHQVLDGPRFEEVEVAEVRGPDRVESSLTSDGKTATLLLTGLSCALADAQTLFERRQAAFTLPVIAGSERRLAGYKVDVRGHVTVKGPARASILIDIDGAPLTRDFAFIGDDVDHEIYWTFHIPVERRPKTEDAAGFFEIGALRGLVTLTAMRRSANDPVLVTIESMEFVMLEG